MLREFIVNFFSLPNLANQLLGTALMSAAAYIFWQFCWPNLKQPARWLIVVGCLILISVGLNLVLTFNATPRPRFTASIDRIYLMPGPVTQPPGTTANDTILILIVSVRNNGAPSVAEVGNLQIVPPNGGPSPKTLGIYLPATITIGLDDPSGTQPTLWLKGPDVLYNKTVVQPVATGSLVRGILEYVAHDATSSQISVPGTKYRLTYTDNFGTSYFAELVWNMRPAVSGYLAGLTEVQAPPSGPAVTVPQSSASPSTPSGQ